MTLTMTLDNQNGHAYSGNDGCWLQLPGRRTAECMTRARRDLKLAGAVSESTVHH